MEGGAVHQCANYVSSPLPVLLLHSMLTSFRLIDEVLKFFERAYFINKGAIEEYDGSVQNGRPKKE